MPDTRADDGAQTSSNESEATTGEETLWETRTHPKILVGPITIQLLMIAGHIVAGIWLPRDTGIDIIDMWGAWAVHGILASLSIWYAIVPLLRWWTTRYTVTTHRVEARWGILYKHSREIPLPRIASVVTERGLLDRIFRCGTLVFHDSAAMAQPTTSGAWNRSPVTDGPGVRFHDVPRIDYVRSLIDGARFETERS